MESYVSAKSGKIGFDFSLVSLQMVVFDICI